jgi:hypothetical protein
LETRLHLDILPQPDDTTCGPTCLHAAYRYFGLELSLNEVIAEVPRLEHGGTLAVLLGCDALRRGFDATIYTYNLDVFDPTWFRGNGYDLIERLRSQMAVKTSTKLRMASRAYIQFLQQGGVMRMEDLTGSLIRKYLNRGVPILTGLSSTYLYADSREIPADCRPDDVRGYAAGHFVVLCGYDKQLRKVSVADPYLPNPWGQQHYYEVGLERLVCSILLGVLTYDANLLMVAPRRKRNGQG